MLLLLSQIESRGDAMLSWVVATTPAAAIGVPGIEWLLLAWLGFVGASIGSFLNVVIYRVPAGLSVVHPGSRCPRCLHAIRGFDNVPVLSWLILRGKCRDCGAPIAARYPSVEALMGAISLMLACVDLFPDWFGWTDNEVSLTLATSALPWMRWAGHFLLSSTLVAAALIEWDGHLVPKRVFIWPIALGVFALWLVPAALGYETPLVGRAGSTVVVSSRIVEQRFAGVFWAAVLGVLVAILGRLTRERRFWPLRAVAWLPVIMAVIAIDLWLGTSAMRFAVELTSYGVIATLLASGLWPGARRFPLFGWLALVAIGMLLVQPWLASELKTISLSGRGGFP